MIISSVLLCISNMLESMKAGERSENILSSLKSQISSENESPSEAVTTNTEDLFYEYETQASKEIVIDNTGYSCYITIPAIDIELPVMSGWDYQKLKNSPSVYSGSIGTRDLIIAAHNYNTHFGKIYTLSDGDEIIITDVSGEKYHYYVQDVEVVNGDDADGMVIGAGEQWDLTLFTCNLSGSKRVTVRAVLDDEERQQTDQNDSQKRF